MNHIEFPGLGLNFHINPIAIPLPIPSGGIRWYAIIILTGIVLACIMGFREYKRLGGKEDDLYNMLLYCIPVSIICARIYYVLFYPDGFGDPQWSPVCVPPQMTVKNMCSAHSISSRNLAIIFFSSRETYTWFLPIIRAVSLCVLSRKNL